MSPALLSLSTSSCLRWSSSSIPLKTTSAATVVAATARAWLSPSSTHLHSSRLGPGPGFSTQLPVSPFLARSYSFSPRVQHSSLQSFTRARPSCVRATPQSPLSSSLSLLRLSSAAALPLSSSRTFSNTNPQRMSGTCEGMPVASPPNKTVMANIDVETVLKAKYPAKAHVRRVVEYIRTQVPDVSSGVIYVEGRADGLLEDCDEPIPFRQRRAFMYLTGADIADCYFVYDIASDKSTLFIPPVDPESVIWSGLPLSAEEALAKYDVDQVLPSTELNPTLARLGAGSPQSTVYAIADRVADSVTFLEFGNKNMSILNEAIDECRVVKDDYEIAMIRKANMISGAAHLAVMQKVRTTTNEYELQGLFLGECTKMGAKEQAYPSIFASGKAAATLHYVHNNKLLTGKDLLLVDAGAEWECYASDITRTFPISGKFTKESRAIYDIVLKMQNDCTAMLKEGVSWDEVHLLAHKIAIDGLLELGILKGDKDAILEARTSAAFLPHGLGHYLGMDTHDVGGHPNYADPDLLFRYLRVRRNLPAGSVITVEPGIYFCDFIINPHLKDPKHAQYIDEAVLSKYWDVGGVRIEDNILVTKDGSINLTDVVKDADELEKIISGN